MLVIVGITGSNNKPIDCLFLNQLYLNGFTGCRFNIYNTDTKEKYSMIDEKFCSLLAINKNIIWVAHDGYTEVVAPIDYITWKIRDNRYATLEFIYEKIFSLDLSNCKTFFIDDGNSMLYKFEINSNIIRLITKLKVLGEKNLC